MPPVRGTVYQAFRDSAAHWAAQDFLCVLPQVAANYGIEARSYSYAQATEEVERVLHRYRAAGLGRGQRVGLMLENRPDFFFHWLALNGLGVSVVPINPEWRSTELQYLLAHSEIAVAVVPQARIQGWDAVARASGRSLIVTTADLSELPAQTFADSHATGGSEVEAECALLYTSGTTGLPKGCVLTNEYFLWAGTWYSEAGGLCDVSGTQRLLTPLPMSHMNAMAFSTMVMLLTGGCIVPLDRFHPSTWWASVRESRATIVHYLGVMPAMLLEAPPAALDQDHFVRFGFGAGVSPLLHSTFEQRFGFPLLEGWAMTETGAGAVVIANREPRKVGTACLGKAGPRINWRIIDENNRSVPTGKTGELLVRSAGPTPRFGFFRGYLKDSEATAQAWDGGYFHTGDLVWADADGDLHFVDRKKNLIRRSGENISAVEVESVLLQHPGVAAVGVSAVPDEIRGDEVLACVVPSEPLNPLRRAGFAHDILDFCLQRLAYFKAPGYVAFCERLPRTSTEKLQRAKLKELAQSLLRSSDCVDLRALKKRNSVS